MKILPVIHRATFVTYKRAWMPLLGCLTILLQVLACAKEPELTTVTDNQAMSLSINITWRTQTAVSGETLPVFITATNKGDQPISVPVADSDNPFLWVFKQAITGDTLVTSEQSRDAMLAGGVAPLVETMMVLAPDASVSYAHDLAQALTAPLLPGTYSVNATLRTSVGAVTSDEATLTLSAPAYRLLASTIDYSLGQVFTLAVTAEHQLMTRVTPNQHPELGTFMAANTAVSATARSLVLAAEAQRSHGVYWAVWLDDDGVSGALARPYDSQYAFTKEKVDFLPENILAGFQHPQGTASFALVGAKDGQRQLRLFHIKGVGQFALENPQLNLPADAEVRIAQDENSGQWWVCWLQRLDDQSIIYGTTLFAGDAPKVLFTTTDQVVSWAVPKFIAVNKTAYVLTQTKLADHGDASLQFIEFDLAAAKVIKTVNLALPDVAVQQWLLPDRQGQKQSVIAVTEQGLKAAELTSVPKWQSVVLTDGHIKDLEYLTLSANNVWLSWLSPRNGSMWHNLFWPEQSPAAPLEVAP